MKIAEVVRVINDIDKNFDVVGLTAAEPMPRTAIKLRKMLNQLPMIKQDFAQYYLWTYKLIMIRK